MSSLRQNKSNRTAESSTAGENHRSDCTRRNFLKLNSAAIGGIALAPKYVLAAETSPRKIRIGIVGGRFGLSFQWHEHPDCIVEAVSDLRPERLERLKKRYGCTRGYNSLEELVRDKNIDAVGIFTEAPLHVQHAVTAMKHGKHVISAVPACYASIEEAELLLDTVKETGLIYMMAETSHYQQRTISARKFYEKGAFGEIYYCESEYQHDGLEVLFRESGKPTWRRGYAPMHYPTHCTAHLVGVTGERLTEVVCHGWGDDSPILKDNIHNNPFWNESAMFKTDRGHAFRVNVWWKGAHRGCERAEWIGTEMSYYSAHPNGLGPVIIRSQERMEKDDAGFERRAPKFEQYDQPEWWRTDMLPEPLRHNSGHQGSHTFLTHEFIDALSHDRQPSVNIEQALAYTVPGIIAHESALRGGELKKIPQFELAG